MSAIVKIESTKAKTRFASLPRQAKTNDVAITRHGHVQAYVLSPERYAHLASMDRMGANVMQELDSAFEKLVDRMQSSTQARLADRLASDSLDTILAESTPQPPRSKAHKSKNHA